MARGPADRDRINSFALVTYIPEPLGGFLDRLRQELVPNCFLRAHVTILPPRPITCSPGHAWDTIRALAPQFAPFDLEFGDVQVFPATDVIYVSLAEGHQLLRQMHEVLNVGGLRFKEDHPYHPHVTLAQSLKPDEVDELTHVARRRWAEFQYAKRVHVDKVVFVQNTRWNEWVDLGECQLGDGESKLVGELTDPVGQVPDLP